MKAIVELRLAESRAQEILAPDEGTSLGGTVRKLTFPVGSPRLEELGKMSREMRSTGRVLFTGWSIKRSYTPLEIAGAALLRLVLDKVFEPAGEELGTQYDESVACERCGAGRVQMSPLTVDTCGLRNVDAAQTITGDEWVVSAQLAESIAGKLGDSLKLRPVESIPADARTWHQLALGKRDAAIRVSPQTVFGVDPFDLDDGGVYRCPYGHVAGLNVLSEVCVEHASLSNAGISVSDVMVGRKTGLLRPAPLLFITPPLWAEFQALGVRGCSVEVAHVIS